MATVYLHIGAPKTATSTLQQVLAKNYKALLKQGVLYPKLLRHGDAHHTLVCDLIQAYQGHSMADLWYGERTRGEAWRDLQREFEQHEDRVEKVILSSELFFGQTQRLEDMLADIRNRLSGHELKVVVYLRRQDQLYSSFYNQDVKGVRQWAFSAYQFYQTHQIFQHDYDELLAIWSKAVGQDNMLIRPYESSQWVGGDIVQDFCALTGIALRSGGEVTANESLGPTQLYIKRCLNRVGYEKAANESVLAVLLAACPEPLHEHCSYVHRGLYRSYRSDWIQVNRRLSRDYLNGEPLFTDPIPPPEKINVYQTDPQLVLDCLLQLYEAISKGRAKQHRSLFARAMLLILAEQDLWEGFGVSRRDTLVQWL